jgi:hypothetical protein
MLRRLLTLFSHAAQAKTPNGEVRAGRTVPELPASGIVTVNVEEWDPDSRAAVRETASTISDLPFFAQHVEHGSALSAVVRAEQCPRCGAATRQHDAHFIYATTVAPRVMLAPAGYFCTACPTVSVDEAMLRAGITGGFQFHGVSEIDSEGQHPPDLFRTWNGRPTVSVVDEAPGPHGSSVLGVTGQQHATRRERKMKQRSTMAKASRKRNRPHEHQPVTRPLRSSPPDVRSTACG